MVSPCLALVYSVTLTLDFCEEESPQSLEVQEVLGISVSGLFLSPCLLGNILHVPAFYFPLLAYPLWATLLPGSLITRTPCMPLCFPH